MSIDWEKKSNFIANQAKYIKSQGYDSVRIFVTLHTEAEEETHTYTTGVGNFCSQIGQIRDWVMQQDVFVQEDARKDATDEE